MKPISPFMDSVAYTLANATAGIGASVVAFLNAQQSDITFVLGSLVSLIALHNLIYTAINKYKRKKKEGDK
jgi:hypothetical protein